MKADTHHKFRKTVNIIGLAFGLLFVVGIIFAFSFGGNGIEGWGDILWMILPMIYPIGLFVGLKWKGPGILISLAGFFIFIVSVLVKIIPGGDYKFFISEFGPLMLIQLIPLILYAISWRQLRNTRQHA